jgi:hypothetical protein
MRIQHLHQSLKTTGNQNHGTAHASLCFPSPADEESTMVRTMMLRSPHRLHRRGYTLVEVMVAMGLSVLTMWILAEAFRIGLEMIGQARAQANLMTQLSAVGTILHRDLVVAHPFLPDDNRPNRGLRLSDQRPDRLMPNGQGWTPPPGGFFRIISPNSTLAQIDTEGLNIYSATNHALHFTAILPENDHNPFYAQLDFGPAGIQTLESRAAEIAYFLVDTGNVTGAGGNRLYNLVRRQRLVALDDTHRNRLWAPPGGSVPGNYTSLIAGDPTKGAWTLKEIRNPALRLPLSPVTIPATPSGSTYPLILPVGDPAYGTDILLSNVLSFEVRVNWDPNPNPALNSNLPPRPLGMGNTEYPYDNLTVNIGLNPDFQQIIGSIPHCTTFDTWHDETGWNIGPNPTFSTTPRSGVLPLAIRVKGIQITIRVFDPKTRSVRQNTWRFAL